MKKKLTKKKRKKLDIIRRNIRDFFIAFIGLAAILLLCLGAVAAFLAFLPVFFKIFFSGRLAAIGITCILVSVWFLIQLMYNYKYIRYRKHEKDIEQDGYPVPVKVLKIEKRLRTCCGQKHKVETILILNEETYNGIQVSFNTIHYYCNVEKELYMDGELRFENQIRLDNALDNACGIKIKA